MPVRQEPIPSPNREDEKAYRIALTAPQLQIPGVAVFGHAAGEKAELPVISHRHKDKFEFVLSVSGIRHFSASGVRYTVYANNVFISRPNEAHEGEEVSERSGEIYWFQLDMSDPAHFLGFSGAQAERCHQAVAALKARQLEASGEVVSAFARAFTLLGSQDGLIRLEGQSLFVYALLRLIETSPVVEALTADIDRAKQYILTHIKEAVDYDELLILTGLSLKEFREKFEKQIGRRPRDYINEQKISDAARLVAQTRLPFSEIAYQYHFPSVAIFKMHFKKTIGTTPFRYRRANRGKR